eukprot:11820706-Prorocentrum_lima.AAC.1
MTSSLVGSEMCIRDSQKGAWMPQEHKFECRVFDSCGMQQAMYIRLLTDCLLYTSDAADDM